MQRPRPIGGGQSLVGSFPHLGNGQDVENRETFDRLRVIERQAERRRKTLVPLLQSQAPRTSRTPRLSASNVSFPFSVRMMSRARRRQPRVLANFAASAVSVAFFLLQEWARAASSAAPCGVQAPSVVVAVDRGPACECAVLRAEPVLPAGQRPLPLMTGVAFRPMMGAVFVVNLLAAHAAQRFGVHAVITAGTAIVGAGCITLIGIGRGASY